MNRNEAATQVTRRAQLESTVTGKAPVTTGRMACDLKTHPEQADPQTQKADQWSPRDGGDAAGGLGGRPLGTRQLFSGDEMLYGCDCVTPLRRCKHTESH